MRRLVGILFFVAACGEPGTVGAPCIGAPTDEGRCVGDAVCTPNRSATTSPPEDPNSEISYCRKRCDSQMDCIDAPGFECRVAAGSMIRVCQPEDEPQPDAGP